MATDINIHQEHSLLAPEHLARWRGLPMGWFTAAPEVMTRNICGNRPLLAMIDAGQAQAEFGFGSYTEYKDIGAGAMGLFNGRIGGRYSHWRCRSVRRIMVELDEALLAERQFLGDDLVGVDWVQDTEFYDPEVTAVLRCMAREIAAGCPNGALYAQSLSMGLLLRLSQTRAEAGAAVRRERGRLSAPQRQRLEALVRHELAGDLSLQVLADAVGFSPSQFTRLFRNSFGQSPHRYVLAQRVARARALVEAGELPLAVVAQACGFSGQSHMTSVFTRELGVPPGSLQRRRRKS